MGAFHSAYGTLLYAPNLHCVNTHGIHGKIDSKDQEKNLTFNCIKFSKCDDSSWGFEYDLDFCDNVNKVQYTCEIIEKKANNIGLDIGGKFYGEGETDDDNVKVGLEVKVALKLGWSQEEVKRNAVVREIHVSNRRPNISRVKFYVDHAGENQGGCYFKQNECDLQVTGRRWEKPSHQFVTISSKSSMGVFTFKTFSSNKYVVMETDKIIANQKIAQSTGVFKLVWQEDDGDWVSLKAPNGKYVHASSDKLVDYDDGYKIKFHIIHVDLGRTGGVYFKNLYGKVLTYDYNDTGKLEWKETKVSENSLENSIFLSDNYSELCEIKHWNKFMISNEEDRLTKDTWKLRWRLPENQGKGIGYIRTSSVYACKRHCEKTPHCTAVIVSHHVAGQPHNCWMAQISASDAKNNINSSSDPDANQYWYLDE